MKAPEILLLACIINLPGSASSQQDLRPNGSQTLQDHIVLNNFITDDNFKSADTCEYPPEFDLYIVPNSCPGECDGTVTVEVFSGTPPFTYWIVADSCIGPFTFFVMDAAGCVDSTIGYMYSEPEIEIAAFEITNATENQSNGSVVVWAYNGVPPYLYSIDGINYQLSEVFNDLAPGAYCITIMDANGCSIKSDTFWIENTTGIFEIHEDIHLYPNPVQSTIYLNCEAPIALDLFDVDGTLLQSSPTSEVHAVDVADLPRGMYIVRMRNDAGSSYQKILLQ